LTGAVLAMPRITISYRRDDSLDITGRIFDRLADHFGREAVFRDIDSIPPGVDFRRHIDRVLDESDIILAIVGPRWLGPDKEELRLASPADPVRLEIETALRKDKPLIPVLVSHAVMPHPDVLPASIQDFVYRNAVQVDSGQDFDVHVGRLIRAIERLLRIDKERTPDEAVHGVITTIEAAPSIALTPKAGPAVAPVAPPVGRPVVQANGGHPVRWVIGLGLVVILGIIGASGWWMLVKQPAEMARREAAAAEKARVEDRAQAAAVAKAQEAEQARQAAAAAKAKQEERARQAAGAATAAIVTMPEVIGRQAAEVGDQLDRLGIQHREITAPRSDKAPGTVIDSSILAGYEVSKSNIVTLTVAEAIPVETINVPAGLIGSREADALATLQRMNLVGHIIRKVDKIPPGTVTDTSPRSGERVPKGTIVDLTVAAAAPSLGMTDSVEILSVYPPIGTRITFGQRFDLIIQYVLSSADEALLSVSVDEIPSNPDGCKGSGGHLVDANSLPISRGSHQTRISVKWGGRGRKSPVPNSGYLTFVPTFWAIEDGHMGERIARFPNQYCYSFGFE
jgi:hypothetical protein